MSSMVPFQGWRLIFFRGVIFAVFLLFSLRLYELQIVDQSSAQLRADENRLSEQPVAAPRGVIFDRFGQSLALNVPAFNLTIVPAAFARHD